LYFAERLTGSQCITPRLLLRTPEGRSQQNRGP
jgi:hypothetical protein